MVDRLYEPSILSSEERLFRDYFEQLVSEFGSDYEIWVRNEDFSRMIAAGVVNRRSEVAVTICFKYNGSAISNPLNASVIERVRHHLRSSTIEDLQINCPS
jgi:hypothetical protein